MFGWEIGYFSANFFCGCIVRSKQRKCRVLPCDTGAVGWCAQREVNVKEAGGKEIWAKKVQGVHLQNSGGHQGHMCCVGVSLATFSSGLLAFRSTRMR